MEQEWTQQYHLGNCFNLTLEKDKQRDRRTKRQIDIEKDIEKDIRTERHLKRINCRKTSQLGWRAKLVILMTFRQEFV